MSGANKLVFVGPMGAGKSTAIRSIADHPPVSTEMPVSGEIIEGKTHTTVALDYSSIELEEGELLHLYGVPGQQYLNFMWPIICDGAIGIVVLADARDPELNQTVKMLLEEFGKIAPEARFAVGITKTDRVENFLLAPLRNDLLLAGYKLPIVKVDARSATEVEFMLRCLLSYGGPQD